MNDSTRRGFLVMAGVGAAATAGVAAAVTAGGNTPDATTAATTALPATAAGPLVAYVQDVRSGRVAVMVGETEVVVHDPELVARLARHTTRKQA